MCTAFFSLIDLAACRQQDEWLESPLQGILGGTFLSKPSQRTLPRSASIRAGQDPGSNSCNLFGDDMSEIQDAPPTGQRRHWVRWIVGSVAALLLVLIVVHLFERKKAARGAPPQVVKVAK